MDPMPFWALTLAYWLHMLATVIWIGGLAALALLVLPAAKRTLEPAGQAGLLDAFQRRLESLGGFSLALLLATGMFQMSANPNFEGFLSTANPWGRAILLKHGLGVLMIAVSTYQAWWVLPALRRAGLRSRRGGDQAGLPQLHRQDALLLRLKLILAALILGATALARAS
jgi:uncharacterized membrane protein